MNPFWILLLAFSICSPAFARVRHIEINQDQIATVKTAIGIATIVQVPDRPNSIVVGDQGAFKVEYLDQAITIKPLRYGAKSNLYVYTDYRRFNVQLVTVEESSADYVVYLEAPKKKAINNSIRWVNLRRTSSNDNIALGVSRVANTRDGVLLVEFTLNSKKKEKFKPEWLWLTQHAVTRPIHNLFLSSLEVEPNKPISGTLQILRSDVDGNQPIRIELRSKKTSYVVLPKLTAWK